MNTSFRLDSSIFNLPVHELRRGYRSAVYFCRSQQILEAEMPHLEVLMQVFQKQDAVLCGIDEAIAILRVATGHWSNQDKAYKLFDDYLDVKLQLSASQMRSHDTYVANLMRMAEIESDLDDLWVPTYGDLEIRAMYDGDEILPWESVMHIKGPLSQFVHLESVYLGVLARRTKIATNTSRTLAAANGKPVLFFADRFDDYHTQGGDGYAAHIGGIKSVATDAMGRWWWTSGMGTMPHALIAAFKGSVSLASLHFVNHYPDTPLVALVDFNNDCVKDALECYQAFGDKLYAVRLDTSENMVDVSIPTSRMGDFKPTGVNPVLVELVRDALDKAGATKVKIVVSGGFTVDKITQFEELSIPVDIYAVGSSLLKGNIDYTADVVYPVAKKGRWLRGNNSMDTLDWDEYNSIVSEPYSV